MEKQLEWQQQGRPFLLAVEDPQQPGTDIGSGSFNIQEVPSSCHHTSVLHYMSLVA